MMLARLLASMKDDDGRVLIDHFYDGIEPLSESEKRAVAEAPDIGRGVDARVLAGLHRKRAGSSAELITLPSLNIRGMASSRVGNQASNVIPATATATIDMRLVKGMDAEETANRFIEHVRKQGYFVVDREPGAEVGQAHPQGCMDCQGARRRIHIACRWICPSSQDVIRTVESARGPAVKMPNSGGTGPDAAEHTLGNSRSWGAHRQPRQQSAQL